MLFRSLIQSFKKSRNNNCNKSCDNNSNYISFTSNNLEKDKFNKLRLDIDNIVNNIDYNHNKILQQNKDFITNFPYKLDDIKINYM
jgi:hypothetical protein